MLPRWRDLQADPIGVLMFYSMFAVALAGSLFCVVKFA